MRRHATGGRSGRDRERLGPATPLHPLLALQRGAGNAAVSAMVVQRQGCSCADGKDEKEEGSGSCGGSCGGGAGPGASKALGSSKEAPDPGQHAVDPNDRSIVPTIRCDGAGGFYVDLGMYSVVSSCGLARAVQAHEGSHQADWEKGRPNSCKLANGDPKPSASRPTKPDYADDDFAEYVEFVRKSECKAYRADWDKALSIRNEYIYTDGACVMKIDDYLDDIDGTNTRGVQGRTRHSCAEALPARPPRKRR